MSTVQEQIRIRMAQLRITLLHIQRDVAFTILEGIVRGNSFGNATGTPVKTGYARGSWHVRQDGPVPEPGRVDIDGGATIAAAAAVIASTPLGQPLWFVNGAEYTIMLEYGHSGQAPAGMVRILEANFAAIVEESVAKFAAAGLPVRA
jgi:hypothetical protein